MESIRPFSPEVRLLRASWHGQLRRTLNGVPIQPPEFVIESGRSVVVVDVREPAELLGPLGYVPGSVSVPLAEIAGVLTALPRDAPLILISDRGRRSSRAAVALETMGMTTVAAMLGGMESWRARGFSASRDPAGVRRELRHEVPRLAVAGQICRDDVVRHIGDPRSIRRVKVAAFLMQSRTSCVDGRDDHGVVGSPGGDAGEFLLALAAIEALTGARLAADAVASLLAAHLDTFGRFYMHTDLAALGRCAAAMRGDPALAGALPEVDPEEGAEAWGRWLDAGPPPAQRQRIIDHLAAPEHVGCGHLRLMCQHADAYRVRPGLVRGFFGAFFRRRWAGDDTDYVILGGAHREAAVVNIRMDAPVYPFTRVPLISPSCAGVQLFINHPQVVDAIRGQLAAFLCQRPEVGLTLAQAGALTAVMGELAGAQLKATLGHLAAGLPIFDVIFRADGSFAVTGG